MSDEETLLQNLLAKAEKGDFEAQYEIAWRAGLGIGLEQNDELGLKWLKEAAANGHGLAQNNLGARYLAGDGVEKNPEEAYFWFSIAAENGDRKAGKNRDTVAASLTPEQLQSVNHRLKTFNFSRRN